MAYTELTCDHSEIPTDTIIRGAMVENADGTFSIQGVKIDAGEVGAFDSGFDNGFDIVE